MSPLSIIFFFFNDTATTEIYTLSLHDALPISARPVAAWIHRGPASKLWPDTEVRWLPKPVLESVRKLPGKARSEEHTSELQSRRDLVCRLLLEKKKKG